MLKLRALKKSTAMLISIAMIVTMLAGLTMTSVSAAGTEKIYNMSELNEVPDRNGATLFDGAIEYKAGETGAFGDIDGVAVTTPGGQQLALSQAIRTKAIEATVSLEAGETMVAYYRGSDSKGSGKDISMVIKSGSQTVATESNTENKSSDVFAIAYKATAAGKYTLAADNPGSVRTELYAIVVTPYDYVDPGAAEKLPPADIGNFAAEAGDGMAILTWDPVAYAESYSLYENTDIDPFATNITETTYTVAGLTNDTQYTFTLEAVNTVGKKQKTVTVTPKESTDPPQAFTLTGSGRDQAAGLTWTPSKNAKTYDVYRNGTKIASDLTALTYSDTGLTNGTEYTYKVTAKNNYDNVDSNEVKVTPAAPPPSEVKIADAAGWLESAFVKWTNTAEVDKYNVYVAPAGGAYTKIDDQLVRYYGNYYRADALGLKAGKYQMKVVPVVNGKEEAGAETEELTVSAHTREGFAFDPASKYYHAEGIGAYKPDGTLKDGAQVLYIDDNNKDTVEFTVNVKGKPTVGKGLVNILSLREKNGAEDTPLAIRMIGQVESPDGKNSSGYVQLKSCKNITFEGVGDDATTFHWSLLIRAAENVEVRNIAVMEFYDDGISLDTDNFNCWVHNCDIFYGQDRGGDQKKGDGSLDVKSGSDYCTFSYNHFWDSGKSSLCGMKEDSYQGWHMTYHHNWFDHSDSRHPRIRGDQVHIYNNYYDGNSKYGVGVTTGGSAFVERNVFRNVKYPMLISMQASDVHGSNEGTFSGEAGGMIKAYDNDIQTGAQSQTYFTQNKPDDDGTIDAYEVTDKSVKVPDTYKSKEGGSTYSNFDTASNMYKYTSDPVSAVVTKVETYAGRVQGGDFKYDFDDAVEDADYDRIPELGDSLKNYKTTLKHSYITPATYPATDGSAPLPGPTTPPIPTSGPTLKPGETPGPTNTPGPTPTPKPETKQWRASKTVTAGETLTIPGLTPLENMTFTETGSYKGFEGKVVGATSPDETGKAGNSLKFVPEKDGKVTVYFKLNNEKTFYIKDEAGTVVAEHPNNTGSSEYTSLSADVKKGQTYYLFGNGTKSEFFGVDFAETADVNPPATDVPSTNPPATNVPATAKPTDVPSTPAPTFPQVKGDYEIKSAGPAANKSDLSVEVAYNGSGAAPTGVLFAAKYSPNTGVMYNFRQGPAVSGAGTYIIENFAIAPGDSDDYKVFLWDSVGNMKPLCDACEVKGGSLPPTEPTQQPSQPTEQPSQPTQQPVTPPSGEAKVWNFGAAPWDTFSLALSKDDPTEQTVDGLKVGISKGIGKDGSTITANATEGLKLSASSSCYFSYTAGVAGTIKFTVQNSGKTPYKSETDQTLRSVKITKGTAAEKEETYCSANPDVMSKEFTYELAAGETIKVAGGTNGFYLPALSFTPAGGSVQPEPSTPTEQPSQPTQQPSQPTDQPTQPTQQPVTPPSGEAKVWNFGAAPWDTFSLALSKDDPTEQTIDGLKVGISKGIGKDGSTITANATEGLKLSASSACYFSYTADVAGTIKFTVQNSGKTPYKSETDQTLRSVKITKGTAAEKEETYCSANPDVMSKEFTYELAAGETIKVTGGTNGFYLPALSFTPAGGSVQPEPSTPTEQPTQPTEQPVQPTQPDQPSNPGQPIEWKFSGTGDITQNVDLGNGLTFICGKSTAYDKGATVDGIEFPNRIKLGGGSTFKEGSEARLFTYTPASAGTMTIYFIHGSNDPSTEARNLVVYQGGFGTPIATIPAGEAKSATVNVAAGSTVYIGSDKNIGIYGITYTPGN